LEATVSKVLQTTTAARCFRSYGIQSASVVTISNVLGGDGFNVLASTFRIRVPARCVLAFQHVA
jgi:hypothetical protein